MAEKIEGMEHVPGIGYISMGPPPYGKSIAQQVQDDAAELAETMRRMEEPRVIDPFVAARRAASLARVGMAVTEADQ